MKCCDIEAEVESARTEVEGDNSPDTQTKVFTVLTLRCRNPQCPNFDKTWEEKIQTHPPVQ